MRCACMPGHNSEQIPYVTTQTAATDASVNLLRYFLEPAYTDGLADTLSLMIEVLRQVDEHRHFLSQTHLLGHPLLRWL
jgi:hypothetical protein